MIFITVDFETFCAATQLAADRADKPVRLKNT
jgi:hypothetical protein